MTNDDFASLLERLPNRLNLVQTSRVWSEDESSIELRDRIDSYIFSQLLLGVPLTVRRIVFLEPPGDERAGGAAEHRSWVSGLVRDLFYLGMPSRGDMAPYRIKQLVRDPHAGSDQCPVEDGWNTTPTGPWNEAFEEAWLAPGCIESNLIPSDYPVGPVGDRNPRWYLWHRTL